MKNKGFTLVELLAVIVILAIIMIIAIPAVLNTMETAKRKSMINFAEKIINEVEKTYMAKTTFGNYIAPGADNYYVYDITTDLGLSNVGDYYGLATIRLYDGEMQFDIMIFNKDYSLSYTSQYVKDGVKLDENLLISMSEFKSYIGDIDLKTIPLKQVIVAANLYTRCNMASQAFVDGATGEQMYCTLPAHSGSDLSDPNCFTAEDLLTRRATAIAKYVAGQELVSCPIS